MVGLVVGGRERRGTKAVRKTFCKSEAKVGGLGFDRAARDRVAHSMLQHHTLPTLPLNHVSPIFPSSNVPSARVRLLRYYWLACSQH